MKFYKINPLFILFLLNAFVFLFWFFKYSNYIPLYDQLFHLKLSLKTFERIRNFDFSILFEVYDGIGKFLNSYLPFVLILPFYTIFGFSVNFYLFVNWLMLNFSFLLIYKIAKELYNPKISIMASFIFLTFPAIYWLSKFFFLEIIATPFLLLTFYLLMKTKNYEKRNFSIFYGVTGSITILLKNICAIPILILHFHSFFKSKVWQDKEKFFNFILSSFFFVATFFFYFIPYTKLSIQLFRTTYFQPQIVANFLLLFPKYLISHLGIIWFAFFTLFFLMKKEEERTSLSFFVIFLSFVLIFSLPLSYLPLPQVRMNVILLPFFAIFLAKFLFFKFKEISTFLILFALIYMILDLNYALTYRPYLEKEEYSLLKNKLYEKFRPSTFSYQVVFTGEEKGLNFNISEIEKILQKISMIDKPKCLVFSFALKDALEFLSIKQNYSITFTNPFSFLENKTKIYEIEKTNNCFIVSDIEMFFFSEEYYEFLYNFSKNLEKNPNFKFLGKYFPKKNLEVKVYVKK